jgi:protein-S-isoprenylcysteine O-methyltransferase Ste14
MRSLELKIPPPLLALLLAVLMWALSWLPPHFAIPGMARWALALGVALAGVSFTALGMLTFRRFRTTIDPTKPHKTSSFVTSGVYRITRNPMYVGVALVLVAWAAFLGAPWPFVGPVLFVLYVTRFQIEPEERILAGLFGEEYSAYLARVRRWL